MKSIIAIFAIIYSQLSYSLLQLPSVSSSDIKEGRVVLGQGTYNEAFVCKGLIPASYQNTEGLLSNFTLDDTLSCFREIKAGSCSCVKGREKWFSFLGRKMPANTKKKFKVAAQKERTDAFVGKMDEMMDNLLSLDIMRNKGIFKDSDVSKVRSCYFKKVEDEFKKLSQKKPQCRGELEKFLKAGLGVSSPTEIYSSLDERFSDIQRNVLTKDERSAGGQIPYKAYKELTMYSNVLKGQALGQLNDYAFRRIARSSYSSPLSNSVILGTQDISFRLGLNESEDDYEDYGFSVPEGFRKKDIDKVLFEQMRLSSLVAHDSLVGNIYMRMIFANDNFAKKILEIEKLFDKPYSGAPALKLDDYGTDNHQNLINKLLLKTIQNGCHSFIKADTFKDICSPIRENISVDLFSESVAPIVHKELLSDGESSDYANNIIASYAINSYCLNDLGAAKFKDKKKGSLNEELNITGRFISSLELRKKKIKGSSVSAFDGAISLVCGRNIEKCSSSKTLKSSVATFLQERLKNRNVIVAKEKKLFGKLKNIREKLSSASLSKEGLEDIVAEICSDSPNAGEGEALKGVICNNKEADGVENYVSIYLEENITELKNRRWNVRPDSAIVYAMGLVEGVEHNGEPVDFHSLLNYFEISKISDIEKALKPDVLVASPVQKEAVDIFSTEDGTSDKDSYFSNYLAKADKVDEVKLETFSKLSDEEQAIAPLPYIRKNIPTEPVSSSFIIAPAVAVVPPRVRVITSQESVVEQEAKEIKAPDQAKPSFVSLAPSKSAAYRSSVVKTSKVGNRDDSVVPKGKQISAPSAIDRRIEELKRKIKEKERVFASSESKDRLAEDQEYQRTKREFLREKAKVKREHRDLQSEVRTGHYNLNDSYSNNNYSPTPIQGRSTYANSGTDNYSKDFKDERVQTSGESDFVENEKGEANEALGNGNKSKGEKIATGGNGKTRGGSRTKGSRSPASGGAALKVGANAVNDSLKDISELPVDGSIVKSSWEMGKIIPWSWVKKYDEDIEKFIIKFKLVGKRFRTIQKIKTLGDDKKLNVVYRITVWDFYKEKMNSGETMLRYDNVNRDIVKKQRERISANINDIYNLEEADKLKELSSYTYRVDSFELDQSQAQRYIENTMTVQDLLAYLNSDNNAEK